MRRFACLLVLTVALMAMLTTPILAAQIDNGAVIVRSESAPSYILLINKFENHPTSFPTPGVGLIRAILMTGISVIVDDGSPWHVFNTVVGSRLSGRSRYKVGKTLTGVGHSPR